MPQAANTINLGFLSDSERELILEVLRRDEELRLAEEQRVRKLKTELLDVKRKGAKRGSGKYSQRVCGRCLEPLSSLTVFSNQCKMCSHYVCRNCRTVLSKGSWLCSVCAKESDIKKRTGDWFYNQRVNRFCANPGHDLVRSSLKKRPPPSKKRETTAEVLLRNTELNPDAAAPQSRQKNLTVNKGPSRENSGSIASRESVESKDDVSSKPTPSDTESAEIASISSSKTETESGRATPEPPRKVNRPPRSSPAGSSVSNLTLPVKADSEANTVQEVKEVNPSPELDVDRLFKKSVRRAPKSSECASTLDLREDERDTSSTSLGKRSKSVPGLDTQEEEEEEEDIDSLVSFHKRTMASSSSSLHSTKSTMGSMMSIYSEAGDYDTVEASGDIIFSVSYDENSKSLLVFIKECHGLAYGNASRQSSNPYVKCYLLPDKSRQSKRKTTVKSNTVNPVYNETLKYSINHSQLFTRSILISVWHHGRLSRNTFLGEVEIALDCRDLDSPQEERVSLMSKAPSSVPSSAFAQYKGDLVISLKYITPQKPLSDKTKGKKAASDEGGELHVLVKEAKNLMAMKVGGTSDSFVKGYLFPSKDLSLDQLKGMCLELTVWDREAMSSNEFLGGVRLSSGKGCVKIGKEEVEMDSVGEEVSLWQKMMQYPDSWAEGTLPLRSTMGKDKGK
uniref:Synaptotagmin-like 4 n=1 Tax=Sphaeramia orbicularis TaxID=375764 RepID=A0A672YH44_9TELE